MSIPKAYFSSLFVAVVVLASTSEALAQKKPKPPTDWQPPPVSDPYTMVLLPTLGGVSSAAVGLNEYGDVAGAAQTPAGEEHAAVWTDAASGAPMVRDLHATASAEGLLVGAAEGWTLWYLTDINDLGQAVGIMRKIEGTTELSQAFRYSPAVETDSGVIPATLDVLPFPPGAASSFSTVEAMNNLGECVGKSGGVPVVWWDGADGIVATDLRSVVGGSSSPMAINDAGQIAGHAHQAWRYTPGPTHFQEPLGGTVLSLGSFGGGKNDGSAAYGINNSGQISGDSNFGRISGTDTRKSYRYTDGVGMQEVGNLGFDKNSGGQINDMGDVTGTGVTYTDVVTGARSRHIFLYYSDRNLTTDVNNAIVNLADIRALGFDDPQIVNGTSLRVNTARQIIGVTGDNEAYPRSQGYMLVPTLP